jgi:hypothetical protein
MDITTNNAVQIVAAWRSGSEDLESPAGPLYAGGRYAPAEIALVSDGMRSTCSWCTASGGGDCC